MPGTQLKPGNTFRLHLEDKHNTLRNSLLFLEVLAAPSTALVSLSAPSPCSAGAPRCSRLCTTAEPTSSHRSVSWHFHGLRALGKNRGTFIHLCPQGFSRVLGKLLSVCTGKEQNYLCNKEILGRAPALWDNVTSLERKPGFITGYS